MLLKKEVFYFLFYYFYLFQGVFFITCNLKPSLIYNCTFKGITALYKNFSDGGVLYFDHSKTNLAINRCVFSHCTGCGYGGAIYISKKITSIEILYSRFEFNEVTVNGTDIYFMSVCDNVELGSSCSSSLPESERVFCNKEKVPLLQTPCNEYIVRTFFFFFFYFFFFLLIFFFFCRIGAIFQAIKIEAVQISVLCLLDDY
jgi:hypothetical protein